VKSSDKNDQSQEQAFAQEPDWEEIEKNLADYPGLADYEEKIREKAACQRLFRFAAEENWTAFQTELAEHPDLAEHEENIRREAKSARLLRFLSEGNQKAFEEEFPDLRLTAEEENELADKFLKKFHEQAWQQAEQSSGPAAPGRAFRVALLYKQLSPQDGIASALGRVIPTLTENTMECFRRASVAEASPVRDLELKYAIKGAQGLAALTRAWDGHHEHMGYSRKGKRD
jgi:hypothetical protein